MSIDMKIFYMFFKGRWGQVTCSEMSGGRRTSFQTAFVMSAPRSEARSSVTRYSSCSGVVSQATVLNDWGACAASPPARRGLGTRGEGEWEGEGAGEREREALLYRILKVGPVQLAVLQVRIGQVGARRVHLGAVALCQNLRWAWCHPDITG